MKISQKDLDDNVEENSSDGPWVLIASAFGLGKRVPVTQFRLQKRAGMGLRAIKFRIKDDVASLFEGPWRRRRITFCDRKRRNSKNKRR